mmetsp:Transcript_21685/g.61747  ORF Transcript_21685/g.61747 Transcript_21685/m.61747 type:complete len:223 (-) Transcript_21685:2845-3513(-)
MAAEDDPCIFCEHSGVSATNERKWKNVASSFRGGSLDSDLAVVVDPTPALYPYSLSQLENIFRPIQLSTGPRTGNEFSKYSAPCKLNTYPVKYQMDVGMPRCSEYGTIGAVLGRPYPNEQKWKSRGSSSSRDASRSANRSTIMASSSRMTQTGCGSIISLAWNVAGPLAYPAIPNRCSNLTFASFTFAPLSAFKIDKQSRTLCQDFKCESAHAFSDGLMRTK